MGGSISGLGGIIGGGAGDTVQDVGGFADPSQALGMKSNFKAKMAGLMMPVTSDQLAQGYQQAQGGLQHQNDFISALLAQQGVKNQSDVFGQMNRTAGQLQGMANGTGPNPAMAQLANTTGQNIQAQGALMAGQRGGAANAGLLARQAGMQGAGIQQQAVGQGAALAAQQQMSALQQLQAQQQMMGNVAGNQVGQLANANNAYSQAAQNNQANMFNAIGNFNNANVAMTSNANNVNSGTANANAQANQQLIGGALNGGGAASMMGGGGGGGGGGMMAMAALADGGMVGRDGYSAQAPMQAQPQQQAQPQMQAQPMQMPQLDPQKVQEFMKGFSQPKPNAQKFADGGMAQPQSFVGQYLAGFTPVAQSGMPDIGTTPTMGTAPNLQKWANGGKESQQKPPAPQGPGPTMQATPIRTMSDNVDSFQPMYAAKGGSVGRGLMGGGPVPGQAMAAGDSKENDTIDARLSPGEIVIPRHITQGKDAPKKAAAFVAAVLAKGRKAKK